MERMFFDCKLLTSLDISNFDTSNVTNMRWMFQDCEALTVIYVGEGWIIEEENTSDMFLNCGVNEVTLKSINRSK